MSICVLVCMPTKKGQQLWSSMLAKISWTMLLPSACCYQLTWYTRELGSDNGLVRTCKSSILLLGILFRLPIHSSSILLAACSMYMCKRERDRDEEAQPVGYMHLLNLITVCLSTVIHSWSVSTYTINVQLSFIYCIISSIKNQFSYNYSVGMSSEFLLTCGNHNNNKPQKLFISSHEKN